jgi:anti-sigma regulatory factor (Ser/Thr protein kinase)
MGCRNSWRVEMGLTELLVNAVEHGNLAIGCERKQALLKRGEWEAEISRRLALPEYAERNVRLSRTLAEGRWTFEISDDGAGFDSRPFFVHDAGRSALPNGRGIALVRGLAFPDLHYLDSGSRLRFTVEAA